MVLFQIGNNFTIQMCKTWDQSDPPNVGLGQRFYPSDVFQTQATTVQLANMLLAYCTIKCFYVYSKHPESSNKEVTNVKATRENAA